MSPESAAAVQASAPWISKYPEKSRSARTVASSSLPAAAMSPPRLPGWNGGSASLIFGRWPRCDSMVTDEGGGCGCAVAGGAAGAPAAGGGGWREKRSGGAPSAAAASAASSASRAGARGLRNLDLMSTPRFTGHLSPRDPCDLEGGVVEGVGPRQRREGGRVLHRAQCRQVEGVEARRFAHPQVADAAVAV